MPAPRPPNVVVFMTDEQPVFMTGCYGDRIGRMPTLDRLARAGTVFNAAYCASPICCPSRAALMTSRHVHAIEVWDNASPLRSDWPTFAHTFRAAGYRTVLCGKMHFVGPDQTHGFEERWVSDIYPATFDWTRSNRHGAAINDGGQTRAMVLAAGVGETEDMAYDKLVIQRAADGLPDLLAEDRPFLLVISLTGPHFPFNAPAAYWDLFDGIDIPLPAAPPNATTREHPYVTWVRTSGHLQEPVPAAVCRDARRAIYGRMALVDVHLRRIVDMLDRHGATDGTLFAFTSDHGDMMGEHGLWFKNTAFEASSRVPLVISGPGIRAGRINETVSLLDLGPTLAGLAGIAPLKAPSDGRNLAPLLRGERPPESGEAVIENYGEGLHRGVRTIVRDRHKLNLCAATPPELFDLRTDPGEWDNVAGDPRYADILCDLWRRLDAASPEPGRYDELRWQSEERRLAILAAVPSVKHPVWRGDWRQEYHTTFGCAPSGGFPL